MSRIVKFTLYNTKDKKSLINIVVTTVQEGQRGRTVNPYVSIQGSHLRSRLVRRVEHRRLPFVSFLDVLVGRILSRVS